MGLGFPFPLLYLLGLTSWLTARLLSLSLTLLFISLKEIGIKARQVCLTVFFLSIGEASLKLRFLNLKLPYIRECPVLSASPFSRY